MWGYTQCKLLDPSNHLHIQTCTLQVEEDKKNMSRMQTLMDNLQLKVQSYKQQIESAVSTWGSCSLMDFLAIYIWLMEICGPELKRQLVREDQLSLKSAHSFFFFLMCMLESSPIVKICATFPFREPKLSPLTFAYTQLCIVRYEPNRSMVSCRDRKFWLGNHPVGLLMWLSGKESKRHQCRRRGF